MSSQQANSSDLSKRLASLETENAKLRKQLEQVEKDRVQYLQNVSHQLVAPLNAIKWHIENLTEARIGIERAKKVLRSIYSQATLAVHLAKNFNLMSNLETEHPLSSLKEPLQDVELCRLLVNLADDFQPLAWDGNIQIKVKDHPFDNAPPVLAMKPLISQVFSNIIENAVKYANKDTIIEIDGYYSSNTDTVTVRIRNRGIGIRPENLKTVFDRGFRSPEAQCKYPAGTGFGLYIASKIVGIHKGTIAAEMEGDWTVFTVMLSVRALKGKARYRE
jgi:signal transduction histidine kinase